MNATCDCRNLRRSDCRVDGQTAQRYNRQSIKIEMRISRFFSTYFNPPTIYIVNPQDPPSKLPPLERLIVLLELGLLIGGGVLVLLILRDQIVEVGLGLEVEEILWQAKKCEMIGISIEDPFVRSFERERKKEDSPR